jgi:hypothetical protein
VEINTDTKTNIDLNFGNDESIFYFPHTLGKKSVDTTLVEIKVLDMKMVKWNLAKDVQICRLNLGTHDKLQVVKLNVNLDPSIIDAVKQLLKELCVDIQGFKR